MPSEPPPDWCEICGEHLDMRTGRCPNCAPIRVVDEAYYEKADRLYQAKKEGDLDD